jgi:hypothetical protein
MVGHGPTIHGNRLNDGRVEPGHRPLREAAEALYAASFASFSALAIASSIVPTI